jgi:hypothetical protein
MRANFGFDIGVRKARRLGDIIADLRISEISSPTLCCRVARLLASETRQIIDMLKEQLAHSSTPQEGGVSAPCGGMAISIPFDGIWPWNGVDIGMSWCCTDCTRWLLTGSPTVLGLVRPFYKSSALSRDYSSRVRRTGKGDCHVIWCSEASCHSSG